MPARSPHESLPVPLGADPPRVLQLAGEWAQRGERVALATVIAQHGSTPSSCGQKIAVRLDNQAIGTVGGGAVEREVLLALQGALRDPAPLHALRTFKLGAELGMCCGGRVEVLLEVVEGKLPVLLVGGGHVGSAVAPLLASLGFAVTLIDARTEYAEARAIAGVRVLHGDFDELGRDVPAHGVCLSMTHDHGLDQDVLEWAVRRGFRFVGGVGSRAKAERTRQRLQHKGFPEADQLRLRMPIGLDIGARSPHEIAVAIAAELIAFRVQSAVAPTAPQTQPGRKVEHE